MMYSNVWFDTLHWSVKQADSELQYWHTGMPAWVQNPPLCVLLPVHQAQLLPKPVHAEQLVALLQLSAVAVAIVNKNKTAMKIKDS